MKNEDKKILICEDDAIQAYAIQQTIKSLGFISEIIKDGMKALERITTDHFDLLIIDMNIENLKGVEVIHFIRNTLKSTIPIIVVSGLVNKELNNKLTRNYSVEHIMSKPFSHNRLKESVIEELNK